MTPGEEAEWEATMRRGDLPSGSWVPESHRRHIPRWTRQRVQRNLRASHEGKAMRVLAATIFAKGMWPPR